MKTKRIQLKDLKSGMKIKTLDTSTNNIVFKEVEDVWNTEVCVEDQRHLIFNNGTEIHCSRNHPIMVKRNTDIVQIYPDDLTAEDIIVSEFGYTSLKQLGFDNNNPNYIDITVSDVHTFFASNKQSDEMILTHNSQGGVRGGAATLYYPIWHLEVEDILVLKNNKGTEDNRVRHLDYGVQFNKVMYERLLTGGNITLFSPHDVPELYDAFFIDVDKFRDLYEKAEKNTKLRKKTIPAIDLFSQFMQERKDTGRIYLMNVDHANDHGAFIKEAAPIHMSNLCCLAGDTYVTVELNDGSIQDIMIKDVTTDMLVYSRNIKTGKDEFKQVIASAMTRENASLMKITDENGNFIVCTPDHRIYTKNRGYVEAQNISENDELLIS
jgi:intein/homing endonuclease